VFQARRDLPLVPLMQAMHAALRSTRGAAVAVARVAASNGPDGTVHFVGVGNIAGMVWHSDHVHHMVSHSGTLGHEIHRLHEFTYEWPAGALVILASDGISTHLKLEAYPGLARHHPALIAGVLYRDFQRGRDDATVVVLKQRKAGQ
jgi:hypothetical protein